MFLSEYLLLFSGFFHHGYGAEVDGIHDEATFAVGQVNSHVLERAFPQHTHIGVDHHFVPFFGIGSTGHVYTGFGVPGHISEGCFFTVAGSGVGGEENLEVGVCGVVDELYTDGLDVGAGPSRSLKQT